MTVKVVSGVPGDATAEFELHRKALTGYCYRMLGSTFEAEDAVQETMLRAWRAADRFEGRSAVKSWLYRIATNVCLDMLDGRKRRARPVDLGPASTLETAKLDVLPEHEWLEPMPDGRVTPEGGDPAEIVEARDTLRLAFVGALQHLPPKQRAVLILREVLRWKATEVAELLDTSVASVNSALQRARAAIDASALSADDAPAQMDGDQQELLDRYVALFEDYDLDGLVRLLHEDATISMPPYALWLQGRESFIGWLAGPGFECKGSRLVPCGTANGSPAFGQYRCDPAGGHAAWALQVVDFRDGRVASLCSFLDVGKVFPLFGLPLRLDG